MHNSPQVRRKQAAFTLVEVVLSLGVIAFAIIGLLGLLPLGLTQFRASMNASIGSQIFQHIVNDAEQSDFSSLFSPPSSSGLSGGNANSGFVDLTTRYFDDEGNEVVPAAGEGSVLSAREAAKVIYHVHVRASNMGPSNALQDNSACFTSLPAAPGTIRFNPRSSTFLTVQIASNPGNLQINLDPTTHLWGSRTLPITTYSAIITKADANRPSSSTGS